MLGESVCIKCHRVPGTQRSGNLKQPNSTLSCNQSRRFCTKRRGVQNFGGSRQRERDAARERDEADARLGLSEG